MAKRPKKTKKAGKARQLTIEELREAQARFRRAAWQRLEAGQFLGGNVQGAFGLDAIYLGGYAIECALKAMLLANTPDKKKADVYQAFASGKEGHNLETLKRELEAARCRISPEILRDLVATRYWTTEMRYETRLVARDDVAAFLKSTRKIVDWMERSY